MLGFKMVDNLNCNGNNANGCTRVVYHNGPIKSVTIEIDYTNSTKFAGAIYETPMLYLVRTLIHESIYANMYFALDKLKYGNFNSPYISEFDVLLQEFGDLKEFEHEFMANYYLDPIAQELENVHRLIDDQSFIARNSSQNWNEFYKNLAWVGLQSTNAFADYIANPQNNQNFQLFNIDVLTNSTKTENCN